MDLIYTNANREDQGVLHDYDLDLAFGADENNFECRIPASAHCCEAGSLLYMEGTEYGGIVDNIGIDTAKREITYKGRTWHGILGSKVILPLKKEEAPEPEPEPEPEVLPEGYTRLEYIESSEEQHIDTGFAPNQDTRVVCDAEFAVASSARILFGCRTSTSSARYEFMTNGTYYSSYNTANASFELSANGNRLLIDKNKNVTTVNGSVVATGTYAAFQSPYNMYLFAGSSKGAVSSRASAKIYFCKIYDNGNLVRDYVPCINADGEPGLYDLVNGAFVANAGSGTFGTGGNVEYTEPEEDEGCETGVTVKYADADGDSLVNRYLIISGDAIKCIDFILNRIGLASLFSVIEEKSGVVINEYQFNRYTDAYSGLTKMLASVGLKLKIEVQDGHAVLSTEDRYNYATDEEFDSGLTQFNLSKKYHTVNHMICLGSGEMENRMIVHLYADDLGNISQEQTQTGLAEYASVFDYPNTESEEELVKSATEELKKMWEPDNMMIDFDDTSDAYDVGDIVGAFDNITGIAISTEIVKKIVTVKNGQITISYKVGE